MKIDTVHDASIEIDLKSFLVRSAYNIQSGPVTNMYFSNKDLALISRDYFNIIINETERIKFSGTIIQESVRTTNSDTIKQTERKVLFSENTFFLFEDSSLVMCPKSILTDILTQVQIFNENKPTVKKSNSIKY